MQNDPLFSVTLASIGDGVIVTDPRGHVSFLNPEAEKLTGWNKTEALGQPLSDIFRIFNERTRQPAENPVHKVLETGRTVALANHTVLVTRTGGETPIDDSAAPIRNPDGSVSGVVLIFRDVAEQRRAMRAQAHLAAIVEHSGDVIVTKDLNGYIQSWNESAERMFGYRAEEVIGKHVTILFPPERLKEEDYILGRLRHGQPVERLETVRVAKNGRRIPVSVSISPLRDPEGNLIGASKIIHDITDLVTAKEQLNVANEKLESHAQQLEKLVQERTARLNELVGDLEAFSYSIVHDLRGPLRAMQSFAHLLAEECGTISPTAQEYINRIKTSATRLDQLIQDGLSYSRLMRTELPLVPTDVNKLLRGIIDTYPAFQPPQAQIELADAIPFVRGNEAGLTQCISNLLDNAIKFVAPGVTPQVRVRGETRGDRVRVSFSDNGIGVPEKSREKIFQIFQRLHTNYEGTGIGLAIVKKAAQRMGGTVGVESENGTGSTFWLELDRAKEAE